jgi:hypothetical protein
MMTELPRRSDAGQRKAIKRKIVGSVFLAVVRCRKPEVDRLLSTPHSDSRIICNQL